jgi:alkanesulfonate monooxygenase SsuD/methylene tetrahydromethanopterin reductase-like flavin-dependent oxidoreductase (luciferase family)
MKVGVFEFAIEYSADPAALAKRAEELGFDSFWVPEHPIVPIPPPRMVSFLMPMAVL